MTLRASKIILIALLLPTLAWAGGGGTGNSDFTRIGAGARAAGMGEAYTAVADDSLSPFWNPAGLALVSRAELSFMHMAHVADINYETLSAVFPSSRVGGWGISGAFLWQPPFDSTTNSFGITPANAAQGTGWDMALAASYGRNFGNYRTSDFKISNISAGVTARLITRTLQDKQANALTLDLGGVMEVIEGLRFALVMQNLGTTATFVTGADAPVWLTKAGLSYRRGLGGSHQILAAYDVSHPMDLGNANYSRWRQHLGLELLAFGTLALRGGYELGLDTGGMTAGVGLHFGQLGIDYAFVPYSSLGNSHRMSLSYAFGEAMSRPEVAAPNPPRRLTGLAGNLLVSLAWEANDEKDVIGYNVYYSKGQSRDFVRTNEKPEPKQNRLTVRLNNDVEYTFAVTSVNASGKESEFSDELRLKPRAPEKPRQPEGLRAAVAGRTVTLTWQSSRDSKTVGYHVYFTKTPGQAYRRLTKNGPLPDAECRLRGLSPGSTYTFVVTSVTKDGQESEFSGETSARPREDTLDENRVPPAGSAKPKKASPGDDPF